MRSISLYILIGIAAVTVGVAYLLIEPAPPKEIRIAAGVRGGAYHLIAQRLANRMKAHGVAVEIVETHGSAQNLALMTSANPPELALVQGGTHAPARSDTTRRSTTGAARPVQHGRGQVRG